MTEHKEDTLSDSEKLREVVAASSTIIKVLREQIDDLTSQILASREVLRVISCMNSDPDIEKIIEDFRRKK